MSVALVLSPRPGAPCTLINVRENPCHGSRGDVSHCQDHALRAGSHPQCLDGSHALSKPPSAAGSAPVPPLGSQTPLIGSPGDWRQIPDRQALTFLVYSSFMLRNCWSHCQFTSRSCNQQRFLPVWNLARRKSRCEVAEVLEALGKTMFSKLACFLTSPPNMLLALLALLGYVNFYLLCLSQPGSGKND